MLSFGTELGVFHVEAGARSSVKFSKAVIADLGERARPYFKSWYMGARYWPGMDTKDMDTKDMDTPATTGSIPEYAIDQEKELMDQFELTEDDFYAIDIAKNVARTLLKHPSISPQQIVGIGKALYALEQMPVITHGSLSEFGICYRAGNEQSSQMKYIKFIISESEFEISIGGSTYNNSIGSDSYSEVGWMIEVDGYRESGCQLYNLEDSISEYINLGAEISVSDESEIEYE